jgi:hypothetical protein
MPIEVIEENKYVAQVKITCDHCGAYIGTRIILQTELAAKRNEPMLCIRCRQE